MPLEIAVFDLPSVEIARRCGVDRIELCEHYQVGGLSPNLPFFQQARALFSGPLFVMIRPRPGNFGYTEEEIRAMENSIRRFDAAGADGFVLGCLKDNSIDLPRLEKFRIIAGQKHLTFHRAIDLVEDYQAGLQQLIQHGCSRVLSSGKATSANEGASALAEAQNKFGREITIMAGGGVRSHLISTLQEATNITEFHSAAITGPGETADEEEVIRLMEALKNPLPTTS